MRFRVQLLSAALVLAGLALSAACDEKLDTITGPSPNLAPTFSSIQTEIFETTDSNGRQACTACHTNVGRTPAGGLNLLAGFSYNALVNAPTLQKPGESASSPEIPTEVTW